VEKSAASSVLECILDGSLAFDVMVASDVFAMLRDARRPEDIDEVAAALARLAKRSEDARRTCGAASGHAAELAHALCDVLVAFHECALAVSEMGRSRRSRQLIELARQAALEVARSAQSLRDFWCVEEVASHATRLGELLAAPRTGVESEDVEASFEALNDACLRAQTLCGLLARRPAIFTRNSRLVRRLMTHGA